MKNASPTRGSASTQPVERGGIVVSQLAAHLRRQVPHLPLDRVSRTGPDAVGVGIVRRPEQVAVAEERNERHRHVVFLEGRVDLPLEELTRLRHEGAAALVGPELLRLPEPPVAVVELLDEPGEPSGAGLGHHHAQSRMTLEDAPGEEVDEGLEEVREEELGVLEDARCLAGDAIARLADEHCDVPGEDDAAVLEGLPEGLPGRVVELGIDVGDHEVYLAHAALGPHPLELGERTLGRFGQHRQADEPVGRGLAEVEQPVVVDAIAGGAEHGIVGRDLEDRPEHHLRGDAVAVHVGQAQLGDGRAARARVVDAGAVEGVVERLDWPRGARRRRLAVPPAPHLPVAHPDRLSVPLLDVRCAVEQRRGQPRRPQIRGQLTEIHVVVAGDEPVSHGVLRSGRSYRRRRRAVRARELTRQYSPPSLRWSQLTTLSGMILSTTRFGALACAPGWTGDGLACAAARPSNAALTLASSSRISQRPRTITPRSSAYSPPASIIRATLGLRRMLRTFCALPYEVM